MLFNRMVALFLLAMSAYDASAGQAPWLFNLKDATALHHAPPSEKLSYGPAPQEYGFLRLPEGKGPFPVVMVIHGGCWMSTIGSIDNTEPLADALREAGMATWSIEYRAADQSGGGFPGTFLDVAHAADYLREIATQYHLDLNHVVVVGHSAGGQLALWLAARSKLDSKSVLYTKKPLSLRGVISLGGVPDLSIARVPAEKVCGGDVIGRLVGKVNAAIPATRYAETSPMEMLPFGVPQVLITGAYDEIVPTALAQRYLQKAKETDDPAQLIQVADAGHIEYIVPNSVAWPVLMKTLNGLLQASQP